MLSRIMKAFNFTTSTFSNSCGGVHETLVAARCVEPFKSESKTTSLTNNVYQT